MELIPQNVWSPFDHSFYVLYYIYLHIIGYIYCFSFPLCPIFFALFSRVLFLLGRSVFFYYWIVTISVHNLYDIFSPLFPYLGKFIFGQL